jgi:hypothetical protein
MVNPGISGNGRECQFKCVKRVFTLKKTVASLSSMVCPFAMQMGQPYKTSSLRLVARWHFCKNRMRKLMPHLRKLPLSAIHVSKSVHAVSINIPSRLESVSMSAMLSSNMQSVHLAMLVEVVNPTGFFVFFMPEPPLTTSRAPSQNPPAR